MKERIRILLFEGIDPIHLDMYRRALTIAFLVYMTYLFSNASEWLTDAGFHLNAETQLLHAATPWPTMDRSIVPFFAVAMYGAGVCLIVGRFVKPALWVVLACALYVQRVDALTAFALNKLAIVGFAVLALAPPPRRVTLSSGKQVLLQSAWPVRVLQATLLIIYTTSGICKGFYGDWLRDPQLVWTVIQGVFRTDLSALLLRTLPPLAFAIPMYFVLVFELFAPFFLIPKRMRLWGVLAGVLLHVGLALMMKTVVFFSLLMVTYYVLFLPAEWLHVVRNWFHRKVSDQDDGELLARVRSVVAAENESADDRLAEIKSLLGDG